MNILKIILQENNLEKGYRFLTKRERKIITLYYLEGYIDKEIASYYKVSRQTINESRQKGIRKLKNI